MILLVNSKCVLLLFEIGNIQKVPPPLHHIFWNVIEFSLGVKDKELVHGAEAKMAKAWIELLLNKLMQKMECSEFVCC